MIKLQCKFRFCRLLLCPCLNLLFPTVILIFPASILHPICFTSKPLCQLLLKRFRKYLIRFRRISGQLLGHAAVILLQFQADITVILPKQCAHCTAVIFLLHRYRIAGKEFRSRFHLPPGIRCHWNLLVPVLVQIIKAETQFFL